MNIKDMIVPFLLAILTTWAVQYFFFGKKGPQDQYRFTAPQSAVECMPLNKEVVLLDSRRSAPEKTVTVVTSWGSCEFSTDGAVMTRLEFNHVIDGDSRILGTIFPCDASRENRAFMIALSNKTPYFYELVEQRDAGDYVILVFKASVSEGLVRKTFTVHKEINQLDVTIELVPNSGNSLQARIFYPAPIMPGVVEDIISADIIDGTDTFNKIARSNVQPEDGWIKPSLFGVENKYFIHAMIRDQQTFAQRAYFDTTGKEGLAAIMEGPNVNTQTSWTLSFYLGPKEIGAIRKVDSRLEQALDYSGMLAPISRLLLLVLNWLYNYLHNYGLAIIVLSVLIKIVLVPLSIHGERGMRDRAEMQKRLAYIQQKYKDDPEARAQAQAEFMRKNGLGLAGCLPMLLQIPIFFGLSKVLSSSIELYKAPFLWMSDLSARDPYYILPVLVMIAMLSSSFSVDSKQRIPVIAMALVFGAISASLSAGLVMYIAISTLLNMVQSRAMSFFKLV